MKRFLKYVAAVILLAITVISGVVFDVQLRYVNRISDVAHAPKKPIAIVLGAAVKPDGTPSDALMDRILTGADLYHASTVDALLMTGDDGAFHVDEIKSMVAAAREAGVPEHAIMTDGHGYRTYESCKRAAQELKLDSALVVTQRFHLGRALYLCNSFGMDAHGVIADRQYYVRNNWFWWRDLLSSAKAFWDVRVMAPKPPVS